MKTGRTHYPSGIGRTLLGALALVVLVGLTVPQAAQADTAANTIIRNTVTVDYDDTAGTAMTAVTGSADVTVILVAATPTLSAPADGTTDPANNEVYNYTLTATANGPDTYNLTEDTVTDSGGDFVAASTTSFNVASLTLGATTVAAAGNILASTDFAITVPSDGANDGVVNGISPDPDAGGPLVADTVVINGEVFTVVSVTDNGGTPGTSTITVNGPTPVAIAVGDVIGEQQSFTLTVTPGTLVASPTSPDVTVTIGAQDALSAAVKAQDVTITTITVPSLDVAKEVSTDGGATFAASANAAPGATLTYRITVTNNGTSDATSVEITDPAPQFTTYTAASAKTATGAAATYAAASALTDADAGDDGYDFAVTTGNTATYSVGTIAPGAANAVQLFFQVSIDN